MNEHLDVAAKSIPESTTLEELIVQAVPIEDVAPSEEIAHAFDSMPPCSNQELKVLFAQMKGLETVRVMPIVNGEQFFSAAVFSVGQGRLVLLLPWLKKGEVRRARMFAIGHVQPSDIRRFGNNVVEVVGAFVQMLAERELRTKEGTNFEIDNLPNETIRMSLGGGSLPSKDRVQRRLKARETNEQMGGGAFVDRGGEGAIYEHRIEPERKVTKILYGRPVERKADGSLGLGKTFDVDVVPADQRLDLLKQHLLIRICARLFPGLIPDETGFRTKFRPFMDKERIDAVGVMDTAHAQAVSFVRQLSSLGIYVDTVNRSNLKQTKDKTLVYYDALYVPDPAFTSRSLMSAVGRVRVDATGRVELSRMVRRFAQLNGVDVPVLEDKQAGPWWQKWWPFGRSEARD